MKIIPAGIIEGIQQIVQEPKNFIDLTAKSDSDDDDDVVVIAPKKRKQQQKIKFDAVGAPIGNWNANNGAVLDIGEEGKDIIVMGKPRSYQQRKMSRYGIFFSPSVKAMKGFRTAAKNYCVPPATPWTRGIEMEIRFCFAIPKKLSKVARDALIGAPCLKKIDVDNLTKFVFDALSKVYYEDDKLIYKLTVIKEWTGGEPCTMVHMQEK